MADPETDIEDPPAAVEPAPAADATTPATAAPTTGTVSPGPMSFDNMVVTPEQQKALQDRLVQIKRAQMASSGGVAGETISRLRRDRAQMEDAYKATALPPDALQEWDVKAKTREHSTDAVEAFGSLGSVFAMLAASFTGAPMETALNAGAAAINAIHAGDEKAYDRDFTAWKENTQLALKRHDIMRQAYNDSILKMNTNLNAGRSELELSARKFGDQQALALLEAGLDGDLNKLIEGRNKTAMELQSTADKVWLDHEKAMDLKSDPNWLSGNPALKAKAIQDWNERWRAGGRAQMAYDAEKDFMDARKREKPDWTPDDLLKWKEEYTTVENAGGGPAGGRVAEIERRTKEYMKPAEEGGLGLDRTAAYDKASKEVANVGKADSGKLTGPQEKARRIKQYEDEIRKTNPELSDAQVYERATAKYNEANLSITGNRSDDIRRQIDMYDNGVQGIDKAMAVLDKYVGAAGAPGYATRLGERVGNIFGSNQTDRAQFAHEIEYLQSIAPRLLNDSSGRPLSAEAKKIERIIAGLNLGDTTANTKRALSEIRDLWTKMQDDNRRRLKTPASSVPGPGETPASTTKPGSSVPKWQQAPAVGPRSSLDSEMPAA